MSSISFPTRHARSMTLEHIASLRQPAPGPSSPSTSQTSTPAGSLTEDTLDIRRVSESRPELEADHDTRSRAAEVELRRTAFEAWEQQHQTPRRLQWLASAGHISLTNPARLGPITPAIRRTADNIDAMTALPGISAALAPHADWLRDTAGAVERLKDDERCPPNSRRLLEDLSNNLRKLIAGLDSPDLRQQRQSTQHDLSLTNDALTTVREALECRSVPRSQDPWALWAEQQGPRHGAWLHALRRLGEAAVSPRRIGERNKAILDAMEDLARSRKTAGLAPSRDENLLKFLHAASFFMAPRHDDEAPDRTFLGKQQRMVALALGTEQPEPVEMVAALPPMVQRLSALMTVLPGLMSGLVPDARNALAEMLRTSVMSGRLSPVDAGGHLVVPRLRDLRNTLAEERLDAGNLSWLMTGSGQERVHQRFAEAANRNATHGLAWQMLNVASNLRQIKGQRHHFVDFLTQMFQAEGRPRLPSESRHEILKALIGQLAAEDFKSAKATDSILGLLDAGINDSLSGHVRADLLARLVAVMPHMPTRGGLLLAENHQVKAAELVANKLRSLSPERAQPVFEMLLDRVGDIGHAKAAKSLVGAMRGYLQQQLMVAEPESRRMESMLPLLRRLIAGPVLPNNEKLGRKLQAAAVQALCVGFPRGLEAAQRQRLLDGAVGSDADTRNRLEQVLVAMCEGRSSKGKLLADVDDATRLGAARLLWILTNGHPRRESQRAFDRAVEDTVVERGDSADGRRGAIAMAMMQEVQMDGQLMPPRLAVRFANAAMAGLQFMQADEAKELMPSLIQGFHRLDPAPQREFLAMLDRLAPQGVLETAITNLSHFQGSDSTSLVNKIADVFHGGTLDPRGGQAQALVHLADKIDSASPTGLNALLAFVNKLEGEHRASALSVLMRDALAHKETLRSMGANGQERLTEAFADGLASTTLGHEQVSALAHDAARYADDLPASTLLAFAPHAGRMEAGALGSLMTAWVNGLANKPPEEAAEEFDVWANAARSNGNSGGQDVIHTMLALARRAYPDELAAWRDYKGLDVHDKVLAEALPRLSPPLAALAAKRIGGLSPDQVSELLRRLPEAKDPQSRIDECYRWAPAKTVEALCKRYGIAQFVGLADSHGRRQQLRPALHNQGANIERRGFVELSKLLDDLPVQEAASAMSAMARNVGARTVPLELLKEEFAEELGRFGTRSDVQADHVLTVAHALLAKFQPDVEETTSDSFTQQIRHLVTSLPQNVREPLVESYSWLTGSVEARPPDVIRP